MKFLTSRVKSNAFAAVMGGIAYLGYKFTGYWASDMQKEISQLWTDSRHIDHIFKYLVEDSPAVAALVALFNDLRSPKDKQAEAETPPQPPVAPAQPKFEPGEILPDPRVTAAQIELVEPIPKVVQQASIQPDFEEDPEIHYTSGLQTSPAGVAFIHSFEQLRLKAYKPTPNDVLTIGWGHTSGAGRPIVYPGMTITKLEADQIFRNDLAKFEKVVDETIMVDIEQHQFDAFVSLCYNIGGPGFAASTAARKFNEGDIMGAADAILMWNKQKGKVLDGLVNRREAERYMFLNTVELA